MHRWLSAIQQKILEFAERRLPALTRLREPEALPIHLHRRRIYVLPTSFGFAFSVLLATMTLGALNYNNNPALILCFLLASAALTSLLRGFLGLRDLELCDVTLHSVHAGTELRIGFQFRSKDRRDRPGLQLSLGSTQVTFSHPISGDSHVGIGRVVPKRGWFRPGRIALTTRQPLGLFVVWSWLHPRTQVLIWPALESTPPPLPRRGGDGAIQRRRGHDEQLHALREYRNGDPLRLVAWKRSAQTGQLLVREFETPAGRDALLDFSTLHGIGVEQRLSRLARWVVDAERAGVRSELRIPGEQVGPDRGAAHVHQCLRALALYGEEQAG